MKKIILILVTMAVISGKAQDVNNREKYNYIETGAPFLALSPDGKGLALGNTGVATMPDNYSAFYNPAKLCMLAKLGGLGISYMPHLSQIANNINYYSIAGNIGISENEVLGIIGNYYTQGKIEVKDDAGFSMGSIKPADYSIGLTYSRKLNLGEGLGFTFRYVRSSIGGGNFLNSPYKSANAMAADIGYYYDSEPERDYGKQLFGVSITNIGSKLNYFENNNYNLPTTLRIGVGIVNGREENENKVFGSLEFKKLLVPTPPTRDEQGVIIKGKDPNRSVLNSIFTSFTDAPEGVMEELSEINVSLGGGYLYENKFGIYGGLDYQSPRKGSIQTFNLGVGLKNETFDCTLTYSAPLTPNSKYRQSIQLTLGFNFGYAY